MKTLLKAVLGLLLLAVVLVAGGVALAWAPDRPVDALKARWASAPSQFIAVQGMQVHLRDEGPKDDPEPIVLLHGTSASLHTWDGWVDALKGQRRVIRLDLPGFGLTGPVPDGDYRLKRYTGFMKDVFDQLALKQVVLAGNSFGGTVSWMTAQAYPDRVSKLVLVDAGGYPYKATSVPIGFKLAQIPALRPVIANVLPRSMIESSVRSVYGDPTKVTPELIDRYYELTLREGNRDALSARFKQSPGGEHAELIKQLRQPTLILWGSQDGLIPPDNAEHFKQDIPGSQLVMFDGLGHVPQEEDPARTVAALKTFLNLK
ncbi:MAG: alpha/beta hydrolase [Aquabacterium sp.]|uniref:alpha/beta fold hydrolase n=1 Tax=Aquabacterium sp. TaxID=1872578 RepID=UPI002717EB34|nr:alpha/beta hydrolase [Aquabacterium sp.]MDO9004688.1 alpha/beta hydrolase [Aquabacterium sp.]